MTWHTVTAAMDEFEGLLDNLSSAGAVITRSCPCTAGFQVTYVTVGD